MYRALYAHNSKLPKYLSFQAGDKFTLIDTSVSDQWFLAQNGLGEIGYVPFNYIKKVEATIDQQVKFIDGAMEAIHLQATNEGGQYTHEQRLIMKKLVKHRAEVIKSARGSDVRSSGRRRPAPAPPVDKSASGSESATPPQSDQSPSSSMASDSFKSSQSGLSGVGAKSKKESSNVTEKFVSKAESQQKPGKQSPSHRVKGSEPRRDSLLSEVGVKQQGTEVKGSEENVRKSKSVTSSIGQAPSLISSFSSNSSEVTTASGSANDSSKISDASNPFEDAHAGSENAAGDELEAQSLASESHNVPSSNNGQASTSEEGLDYDASKNPFEEDADEEEGRDIEGEGERPKPPPMENHVSSSTTAGSFESQKSLQTNGSSKSKERDRSHEASQQSRTSAYIGISLTECGQTSYSSEASPRQSPERANNIYVIKSHKSAVIASGTSASSDRDGHQEDDQVPKAADESSDPGMDDLPPPPPPEVYDDISLEQFEDDSDDLLPAPPDLSLAGEHGDLKEDELYVNLQSDIQELCGRPAMENCTCDNFQPKFSIKGDFFASNAMELPAQRRVRVTEREDSLSPEASKVFSSLLKCQGGGGSQGAPTPTRLLCLAQAHNVQVTHADCEEMIGEFRKVSGLSHEEGHWAMLSAMNLLAAKVPHIKPSLEAVALRFKMGHQCQSTGKDYQSEDACTLDTLVSELADVMGDAQQRSHYLRDDLDNIIDMVTGLTDTLNNAKHCVSVAAIRKEDYRLVELIAKYYQMETRWVIHSCLLLLVETLCRAEPRAMQEFIYSELPQELVHEMQQHQNDGVRLMQVAHTLGVVFMKGQALPHKLRGTMDVHFFLWLLGVSEQMSETGRPSDVDTLLALLCAYLLQYADSPSLGCQGDPLMDAFKMAQAHALLSAALAFLSKHEDPTSLLGTVVTPKVNSALLLLLLLYDSPDTADLLYTNDAQTLVAIFEEFLRDLTPDDPMRLPMMQLVENFLRTYPDTAALRDILSSRIAPLLLTISHEGGASGSQAARILGDNTTVFDDV